MKVLILGAGGAASNGFARALRLAGGYQLVGTNCSETDLWLSECETNHLVPHVNDFDGWRVAMFDVIRREKPMFVHAQSDREVWALGRIRNLVHMHGAKTWLPSQSTIELCQDKWATYQRWRDAGLEVPHTVLVKRQDSLTELIGLGPHSRVWLRPKTGAGGQKSLCAESFREAVLWVDKHNGWGEFTAAEVLTDRTVTVQQLYWHGELVASQQRRRDSWANAGSTTTGVSGSTGVGVTSNSREADRVADLAVAAVAKGLGKPHGLFGVDMTYNQAGVPCPTEINIGRFFTTAPEFFAMAGFNMADYFVRQGENAYYMRDHGHPVVPVKVPRNPIAPGKKWIRGMDHMPVLVS